MSNNKFIYGDQNFSMPWNMNFGAIVLEKIKKYGDNVALIHGSSGEQITFRELAQQVVNTASSLTELGVKPGDVVALCSENRIEFIITTLAISCVGGVVTFYNYTYTKSELSHALDISKPKYVCLSNNIINNHYEEMRKRNISGFIVYGNNNQRKEFINFDDLRNKYVDITSYKLFNFEGQKETGMILYSSGTTGPSKGARISNLNLLVCGQQPLAITSEYTILITAPWSSTMGIACLMQYITNGRKTVFLQRYEERVYLQTIQKYKVQFILVAPPIVSILCKSTIANEYDLTSIKIVYSGGAPLNQENIIELKLRYPHIKHVLQGYGMTETTGATTQDYETSLREGSVGRPAPGIIVKVVDPDTGKLLESGKPGEVCVRGPALFEGYIGIPSSTVFDDDGFYKTGDIAYYDEDGYFYIVDRIKELIKYNAWQVSPSELEALLLRHPEVKDAGVVGAPDPIAGELPTAFIVKQPHSKVTEKDIIDFMKDKVASWKRLRGGVIFIDEIPKNPSGKILRRQLKQLLPISNKQKNLSKL